MVAVFSFVSSTSFPQHRHLSCACLTHNWAAANGCFLGGGHTPEWKPHCMLQLVQLPALCIGLEICLYFTGTKCHGCSYTTKECSTQSSITGFSPESCGRGHAAVINYSPHWLCKISAWVYVTHLTLSMQRQELSGCLALPSLLPAHLQLLSADQSCQLRKDLK